MIFVLIFFSSVSSLLLLLATGFRLFAARGHFLTGDGTATLSTALRRRAPLKAFFAFLPSGIDHIAWLV